MDELVERVREALAAEYSGAADGRVRDVPDRRAIRWYTTIGLVDRPLGMRGRTALYGPRHLQQLVAIKRRQAVGRSLSQIQGELSWVSDEALAELSQVPERLLETDDLAPEQASQARHMRFWAQTPAEGRPPTFAANPAPADPDPVPADPNSATAAARTSATTATATDTATTTDATATTVFGAPAAGVAASVSGVALRGGAILLVPNPVSDRDRDDIAAAAAPLLDLLEARGLIDGRSK